MAGRIPPAQWAQSEIRRTRNRISNQRRGKGNGWLAAGITLAFGAELEAEFQAAARLVLGGRAWCDLPDPTRDRLRWAWRRYQRDRPRAEAWQAKARAILLDLAARGPVPDGIEHDPGTGAHVVLVERRPFGFSLRTTITDAELDKALALPGKVKARLVPRPAPPSTVAPFDLDAFLQAHAAALRPVLALSGSEADTRAIALSYRAVLAGGLDARGSWLRLLRQLRSAV